MQPALEVLKIKACSSFPPANRLASSWVCVGVFSQPTSDRTRGDGLKLHQGRFRSDIGENFFAKRVVRRWPRLPRAVGESPSPEGFKNRVGVALGDMV